MKSYKIELKWALIFELVLLLWMVGEKAVGLHDEHIDKHLYYTNLFAIPAIVIYVFALLEKRKKFYKGTMSYKQGFVSGLVITLIIAVLSPAFQYIISTFITPEYFPNVIAYVVENGSMTQEDAEEYFSLRNYMIQSLTGALIMGVITSAIVAIFTRKNS